jgi:hypothetical protein
MPHLTPSAITATTQFAEAKAYPTCISKPSLLWR